MHDDKRFPNAIIIISGQIYNFHLADDKKGGKSHRFTLKGGGSRISQTGWAVLNPHLATIQDA